MKTPALLRLAPWSVLLLLAVAAPGLAEKTVEYDHLGQNQDASYTVKLEAGETLKILVKNTYPDQFSYEIGGIPLSVPTGPGAAGGIASEDLETKTLTQIHDKKYGGYIVRIRNTNPADPVDVDGTILRDVTLIISAQTLTWNVEIAGAFTVSGLTNPVYAAGKDEEDQPIIVLDSGAEDEASLGLGAMIHTYNEKYPHLALTFGLGTSEESETTYYLGPSWRFNDKAALTVGYAWGSVDRLPAGMSPGDPLPDATLLNDLKSRIDGAWFFSLSYSFIDVKDRILKPFKGEQESSATAATGATAPAAGRVADASGAVPAATTRVCVNCDDDPANDDPNMDCDGDEVTQENDADDCNQEVTEAEDEPEGSGTV